MTVKKIRIASTGKETEEALREFIEPRQIPVEYGGTLQFSDEPDSCRWHSPEEKAIRELVHELNRIHADDDTVYKAS